MRTNTKGVMDLGSLAPAAIAFVFVAVVLTIGSNVLSDVQDGFVTGGAGCNDTSKTGCGANYNATESGLDSLTEFSGWLPTIALVIAAAVVIGVLAYFRS